MRSRTAWAQRSRRVAVIVALVLLVVGPIPAKLPVGINFAGKPFGEATLLKIAAAYEAETKQRVPPPDFGPLPEEASTRR